MYGNKCVCQIFITHISDLNLSLEFCEDNILIIEIVSTKFYENIHHFNPVNEHYWEKLVEMNNREEPNYFLGC